MSSFNNLFNRMETLNEAKVSPVGKQAPVFKDVPKQMKAAGMAASSRDAMIFITQVLSRLDIITPEVYEATIKGQHRERMEKLMAILKNHEEDINAKEDDIVKFINDNLDNYTSGAGTDRNRTEKYKETAKKISKEVSNIAAGKEADDGLRDILHFVNDTMQDMDIQKSDDDTEETGPVRAAVDAVMANLRKEAQGDPDAFPPYIIEDLEEFVPKIMTLDQYKSFVKQLAEFSKEDQYYEKPVLHFIDSVKAIEDGIADNVANAEDGESDNREHGSVEEYYPEEEDPRAAGKALNDARDDDEAEKAAAEEVFVTDPAESNEAENEFFDKIERRKLKEEPSVEDQVHNACMRHAGEEGAESAAGMAAACQEMYEMYGEEGDQEKAEIAEDLRKYYAAKSKSEDEELTLEGVYDVMGFREIKAPVMDENGKTSQDCSTQQYLTEAAEQEIEEAGLYTEGYLVEQKTTDSYIKSKPAQGQTFKERYNPKTSYQLEELRRYGL